MSTDRFLVFAENSKIIGMLSFDTAKNPIITRLVVRPSHLRQGVATAMLAGLESRIPPGTVLTVSTAEQNAPAVLLYQRAGFSIAGTSTSSEGIRLIRFEKTIGCSAIRNQSCNF